jgi:hypothetical protein
MRDPRIFLSLVEIAGYYSSLKDGFEQIGITAETGFVSSHKFNYQINRTSLQKCVIWAIDNISDINQNETKYGFFKKILFYLVAATFLILFFFQSLVKFDVFVFGFRKSFLPWHLDLPIIKLFNKRIIFVFHGSDTRKPLLNGVFGNLPVTELAKLEKKQKQSIAIIEKYADHIITQPAISQCHNRSVINWIIVGMPFSKKNIRGVKCGKNEEGYQTVPIILHCPSKPQAKGTEIIRNVIYDLKAEGYRFQYKEIINKSHDEVLAALDECTFVVDQLYSDLHMAGFATEAAFYRKPAIVGGYELDKLSEICGSTYTAPTYQIKPTPSDLKKAIIFFLENPDKCEEMGREAQLFVEKYYNPSVVAKNFLKVLNNDIPDYWIIEPDTFKFDQGCAISAAELSKRMKNLARK